MWGDRAALCRPCPQLVPEQLPSGFGVRAGSWKEPAALPPSPRAAGTRGGGQERGAQNNSVAAEAAMGAERQAWSPGVSFCFHHRDGRCRFRDVQHHWLLRAFIGDFCCPLGTGSVAQGIMVM